VAYVEVTEETVIQQNEVVQINHTILIISIINRGPKMVLIPASTNLTDYLEE